MRITVSGRVQGVGFRASCAREAKTLGVVGSVLNLPDGSVAVVAEGEESAVNALITWCHSGPAFANVQGLECQPETPQGDTSFRILG